MAKETNQELRKNNLSSGDEKREDPISSFSVLTANNEPYISNLINYPNPQLPNSLVSETENNRQQLMPKKQKAFNSSITPLTQAHSSIREKKGKKANYNLLDTKNVIKVMPSLKFNDKGHITALKFGEYKSASGRESYNIPSSRGERHIANFKISWENIPSFAIITGANGSGKSYLLEIVRKALTNNSQGVKFTYLSANAVEKYDSHTSSLGDNFVREFQSDGQAIELLIFNLIKDNINNHNITIHNEYITHAANIIAQYLLDNVTGLKEKEDDEIKKIITNQCNSDVNFIVHNTYKEINHSVVSIIYSVIESYKQLKIRVADSLKSISRILDEPYEFWKKQHPEGEISDFKNFLKNQNQVDELIEQLIHEAMLIPNALEQINKMFPESFPYKLIQNYSRLYCYPRELPIQNEDQIDRTKLIELEHMSSGEQLILKIVSLVYYNQGLRSNREEKGVIVSKSNIILLDEPDRHLDPAFCKIFFDFVDQKLVGKENIQVIMTTHRIDTVALAPKKNIYTMKKGELSFDIKPAISKSSALSELSRGLCTAAKDQKYVMLEADDDVKFYSVTYKKFLSSSLLPSNRTELIFVSVASNRIDPIDLNLLYQFIDNISKYNKDDSLKSDIEGCIKIVSGLKETNVNRGGCGEVKQRLKIAIHDIKCDSNGVVMNKPFSNNTKAVIHTPEMIWGLIDQDNGNKAEGTLHVLRECYSFENYLCMPLNIIFFMAKAFNEDTAESNKLKNMLYTLNRIPDIQQENNFNQEIIQEIADYAIKFLSRQISKQGTISEQNKSLEINLDGKNEMKDLKLACGLIVNCPKILFSSRGHDLQEYIGYLVLESVNSKFNDKIKGDKKKDNIEIIKSLMNQSLQKMPAKLLPFSLLKTFEELILGLEQSSLDASNNGTQNITNISPSLNNITSSSYPWDFDITGKLPSNYDSLNLVPKSNLCGEIGEKSTYITSSSYPWDFDITGKLPHEKLPDY